MGQFQIKCGIFSMIFLWSALSEALPKPILQTEVFGAWKLTKMLYEGNEMDLPNPALRLTFSFFANHSLRIYWDRQDSTVFCEGFSNWIIDTDDAGASTLKQNTFAVNPMNAGDCAQDPDMKLGIKESVPIWINNGHLLITLRLGDQNLTYLFYKQNKEIL